MRHSRKTQAIITAIVATWAATQNLHAQNASWATATSGTWSTATKWNPTVVPSATSSVYIDAGSASFAVTLDNPTTIARLIFGPVAGTLNVDSSAALLANESISQSWGNLNNAGTMTTPKIDLTRGTLTNTGSITASTVTVNGGTLRGIGTVHLSSASKAALLVTAASTPMDQNVTFDGASGSVGTVARPTGAVNGGNVPSGMNLRFAPTVDTLGGTVTGTLAAAGNGTTISNSGSVTLAGDVRSAISIFTLDNGSETATFRNQAQFTFAGGSTLSNQRIVRGNFSNEGMTTISDNVAVSLSAAGSSYSNSGSTVFGAYSSLVAPVISNLAGGTFTGGAIQASTFSMYGGTITSSVVLGGGSTTTLVAGTSTTGTAEFTFGASASRSCSCSYVPRTVRVNFSGPSSSTLYSDDNYGVLTLAAPPSLINSAYALNNSIGQFDNYGTLTFAAGASLSNSRVVQPFIYNHAGGVINVTSGVSLTAHATTTSRNLGTMNFSGCTASLYSIINQGMVDISGTGSRVTAAYFYNYGTVAVSDALFSVTRALSGEGVVLMTSGTLSLSGVTGMGVQRIVGNGAFQVSSTTASFAAAPRVTTVTLSGAILKLAATDANGPTAGAQGAASGVMSVGGTLTINASSRLDLTNNALVLPATASLNGSVMSVANLRKIIIAGRGGVGTNNATWNGAGGIGTSAYNGDEVLGSLGYIWNADPNLLTGALTSVNGYSVSPTDYVVKFTAGADANLDGVVDDIDVAVIGLTYDRGATTGHHWYDADFNYDGKVDDDDVAILGLGYAPGAVPVSPTYYAPLAGAYDDALASGVAVGGTVVPEPQLLGVLGLLGWVAVRRRGRG